MQGCRGLFGVHGASISALLRFVALGVVLLLVDRELKRRETRERIVDSATDLVEEHGFDNVTVKDICAKAGISRRTFFNYMDGKDEAVLGPAPLTVTDDALRRIAETQADNLVDLIISATSHPRSDIPDHATVERRRAIFAANPTLTALALTRRRTTFTAIAGALEEHFETFPGDRLLPDQPVSAEIHAIIEIVQSAVSITAHCDLRDNVRGAASFITDYARRLEW